MISTYNCKINCKAVDTYIRRVADKLTEKDLLVGVESVDDQTQKLIDLRLEGKGLCLGGHVNDLKRREKLFSAVRVLSKRARRRRTRVRGIGSEAETWGLNSEPGF